MSNEAKNKIMRDVLNAKKDSDKALKDGYAYIVVNGVAEMQPLENIILENGLTLREYIKKVDDRLEKQKGAIIDLRKEIKDIYKKLGVTE